MTAATTQADAEDKARFTAVTTKVYEQKLTDGSPVMTIGMSSEWLKIEKVLHRWVTLTYGDHLDAEQVVDLDEDLIGPLYTHIEEATLAWVKEARLAKRARVRSA